MQQQPDPGVPPASPTKDERATSWALALGGLIALAVAMGIGRFAFTPMLPIMQADVGLSVKAGSWLASANYAGYLAGALAAARWHVAPLRAIVVGVLTIAVTTLAMGVTHDFSKWILWRAAAGIASAFVLVHISAWAVQRLASLRQPALAGVVFAGVGVGIIAAGLICLVAVAFGSTSAALWLILGAVSALALLAIAALLRAAGTTSGGTAEAAPPRGRGSFTRDEWRLILCYSAFGFGYIIPATFLPVMAREAIRDPASFGWAWPLFGMAAAVVTLIAGRVSTPGRARRSWAISHFVMAAGCAVAALFHTFVAVLIAALAVGGTFIALTMYAMQEARLVAGSHARPLIGAMTAAFAVGQIVGPLLVHGSTGQLAQFGLPLLLASLLLSVSGWVLLLRPRNWMSSAAPARRMPALPPRRA